MSRLGIGLCIAIAVLLAVIAGAQIERAFDFIWAPVVASVVLEIVILLFAVLVRPDRNLPFLCDPIVLFPLFQAQFFVIGALSLPFTHSYAETPLAPTIVTMTVLGFVGLLVTFLIGAHLPIGVAIADALPSFETRRVRMSGRWIEMTMLLLSIGACFVYVVRQKGFFTIVNRGYNSYAGTAIFIAPFLILVLTLFLMGWRIFGAARKHRGNLILLVGSLAFAVTFWGFLLGTRKFLFYLFFGLSAIFILRRGMKAVPRFVLPSVMLVLVCYLSIWGTVRGRPIATFFQDYADPRYGQLNSLSSGYFESLASPFGTAALTLTLFPDVEPYRYGQTLLVALFSPIPRAIWPNKPIGLGKELTWYLGSYYAASYTPTEGLSVTPTLVGDFYANLGVIGILLGGFGCGVVCRTVAAYAAKGMRDGLQTSPARVLIPAVFLAGLVELRADLAAMTIFYMYTLIPLVMLLQFFDFGHEHDGSDAPATG
jgi:hypothetical protein